MRASVHYSTVSHVSQQSCVWVCGSIVPSTLRLSASFARAHSLALCHVLSLADGEERRTAVGVAKNSQSPVASGGCRVATVVDPTPRSRSLSCARSLSLARSLSSLGVSPSLSLIPRLSVRETCARTSIRVAKGHFALLGGHQEEIVGVNGRGRQKDPSSLRTRKFPRTPPPPSALVRLLRAGAKGGPMPGSCCNT